MTPLSPPMTSPASFVPIPKGSVSSSRSLKTPFEGANLDWEPSVGSREKMFIRRQQAKRVHERLFTTDLPISLAAAGATYFGFNQSDSQTRMVKAFQQLVRQRSTALDTLSFLKEHGVNARQNTSLISPASTRLVAPLELMLQQADSPALMTPIAQRLTAMNPTSGFINNLSRAVGHYGRAQQYIVRHPKQLKDMMIPMVTRLLELSPFQAKVMAASRPQEILNRLFGRSLEKSHLTPRFFKQVFDSLKSANRIRSLIVSGSVLATLLGVFVTRMEMQMEGGR